MSARSAATNPGSPRVRARRDGLTQTVAAAADLLEEGDRAHAGISTDARDLLLDEIEPDASQPRRHFDETELRLLADDIARRGIIQPILVRPPVATGEKYRLIAGERRWRAARMAGKVRIPARVREMSDEDVHAAQMAENVLRAGLTDIEKGRALRSLYELRKTQNQKATWEDVAAEVGLGRARIHDLFHLASLPEPVAALIESGRLSGSHGIALQRARDVLPEEDIVNLAQQAARPQFRRSGGFGMSVARLRREIHAGSQTKATFPAPSLEAEKATIETVRPFVRRTIEAVTDRTLTDEERRRLVEALMAPRAETESEDPRGNQQDHPRQQRWAPPKKTEGDGR